MTERYNLRPNVKGRRPRQSGISTKLAPYNGSTSDNINNRNEEEVVIINNHTEAGPRGPEARRVEEGLRQTQVNIQADRERVEARRQREAAQIKIHQLTSVYEAEMSRLQELIEENHRECKGAMTSLAQMWRRDRAIERGESAEEEAEAEDGQGKALPVAEIDDEMEVGSDYVPTETSSTAGDDDHNELSIWSLSRPSLFPP